jgi:sortase A
MDTRVRRRTLLWTERGLFTMAALLLGAWSAVSFESALYGWLEERRLAQLAALHSRVEDAGPVAVAAPLARGALVGRIELPRLGLRAIVAHGDDPRTLRRAVGHLPGTPLPGQAGNVVLAGHRDTFFRPLKDVRPGDDVRVVTPDGTFTYAVEQAEIVAPGRTDLLAPSDAPTLTLVTCYPFYLVGHAPDRFVVRARLVEVPRYD